MNAGSNSLRSFVERIERLQEDRKAIADDIADLFKELDGEGFDKQAVKAILKIRAADDGLAVWTERSATVDLYLSALGMLASPAPARTREIIEEFPAGKASGAGHQSGIRNPAKQEHGHVDRSAAARTAPADTVVGLAGQIEPRTKIENFDGNASLAAREGEQAAAPIPNPAIALPHDAAGQTPDVNPPPASGVTNSDDVPMFLRRDVVLRPHCQRPELCGGYGRQHCGTCERSAQSKVAA